LNDSDWPSPEIGHRPVHLAPSVRYLVERGPVGLLAPSEGNDYSERDASDLRCVLRCAAQKRAGRRTGGVDNLPDRRRRPELPVANFSERPPGDIRVSPKESAQSRHRSNETAPCRSHFLVTRTRTELCSRHFETSRRQRSGIPAFRSPAIMCLSHCSRNRWMSGLPECLFNASRVNLGLRRSSVAFASAARAMSPFCA
jgi:hypothetical protein